MASSSSYFGIIFWRHLAVHANMSANIGVIISSWREVAFVVGDIGMSSSDNIIMPEICPALSSQTTL